MSDEVEAVLAEAAGLLAGSRHLIAFTGAGISKESGVPTFRGEGGLWGKVDPSVLEINRFRREPELCWRAIRELFYVVDPRPKPNRAHEVLAKWESEGRLDYVITQNIDGLHKAAGSTKVAEFHGSLTSLLCTSCGKRFAIDEAALARGALNRLPPRCGELPVAAEGESEADGCGGLLKPDFVFFGEAIPSEPYLAALTAAESADCCLVVGSTGLVYPAAEIPLIVKRRGGIVVEIDPSETEFTSTITDLHLALGAVEAFTRLDALLENRIKRS